MLLVKKMIKQVVLLAGGKGTRMREMTETLPKPMVEIGGIPVLEHLINIFNNFGEFNFLIASGYKSEIIEKHFNNHANVKVIYTGEETLTGGRVFKLSNYLEEEFIVTYGDGLADINIHKLIEYHHENSRSMRRSQVNGRGSKGSGNCRGPGNCVVRRY